MFEVGFCSTELKMLRCCLLKAHHPRVFIVRGPVEVTILVLLPT